MKRLFLICLLLFASSVVLHAQAESNLITQLKITPSSVHLEPGEQQRFIAYAYSAGEKEVPFQPLWSASGGEITPQGWFTAGGNEGTFYVTVKDAKSGVQAEAKVTVGEKPEPKISIPESGRISRLELRPEKVTLKPGEKIDFVVRAFENSDKRMEPGQLLWRASGGSITSAGVYQAGGAPGKYVIQVKEPNGASAQAEVTIEAQVGEISRISIVPAQVRLRPETTRRFSAVGYNSAGNVVRFTPRWQATGGTIDKDGVYQAGEQPGNFFVKAIADNGVSSTATVLVEKLVVGNIEISPYSATLSPGQSQKFETKIYDTAGRRLDVFPIWSATGGIIQADGTYIAGNQPGDYSVTVTAGTYTVQAHVSVRGRPAGKLKIFPQTVVLQPGGKKRFVAYRLDGKNKKQEQSITWQASGGTIDNGVFQAGKEEGTFTVMAKGEGNHQASAKVIIKSPAQSKKTLADQKNYIQLQPQEVQLHPGEQQQFKAILINPHNKKKAELAFSQLRWKANGGTVSSDGVYTAGEKTGKFYVAVLHGPSRIIGKTSLMIKEKTEPSPEKTQTVETAKTAASSESELSSEQEVANEKIEILRWQIDEYQKGVGTIQVIGKVQDERAKEVELFSYGQEDKRSLYKLPVTSGEKFHINATYIYAHSLALAVYDQEGKVIFLKQDKLP